ncbi:MAG: M48 family metallopeptidase [Waterburya sp.]
MNSRAKSKIWQPFVVGLLLVSILSLSVSANSTVEPKNVKSINDDSTLVAIDILDAVQGAVQYIQVSNISDEQEVEIGKQTNEQILSQYPVYDNAQVQEYVSNLGQELLNSSDSRDIPFTFQVVDSEEVNAFATPGGFVYVTTGILQTAETRAQLASVLGHEISHINKKHGIKALKKAVAAQGIAKTVGVDSSALAQIAYQVAVDLPNSRDNEYEADRSGLEVLQQAGYPGEAFAEFLAKLKSSGGTPEFLNTHPSSDSRIEAISELSTRSTGNKGQDRTEYQNNVLALM